MPLFEYRCPHCEETFEKLLGKPEPALPCPHCGRPAPRAVSGFAAVGGKASGGGCSPPAGSGFR